MTNKDHEKIEPSDAQNSPNLCDPRDWTITHGDEYEGSYREFGGQCGKTKVEYQKLLREGELCANASDFDENAEQHPDVNRAGKPRTP
jgi:hypothetical protein